MINDDEDRIVHGGELEYDSLEEAVVEAPKIRGNPHWGISGAGVISSIFMEHFIKGKDFVGRDKRFKFPLKGDRYVLLKTLEPFDAGLVKIGYQPMSWNISYGIKFCFCDHGQVNAKGVIERYDQIPVKEVHDPWPKEIAEDWIFLKYYKLNSLFEVSSGAEEVFGDVRKYIIERGIDIDHLRWGSSGGFTL